MKTPAETKRWVSYIDIEGFGSLYDQDNGGVLLALCELMRAIFLIAEKYCAESPDRIFAHQTGDGFAVVGEFNSESWLTPVAITVALLRHVAWGGRFAKATLGEGEFMDITDCYPKLVLNARDESGTVRMGGSVMTLFPVMGTALIDAVGIQKRAPSGALFAISADNCGRIPANCVLKVNTDLRVATIDWVGCRLEEIERIQAVAGLRAPTPDNLRDCYAKYVREFPPPEKWTKGTTEYACLRAIA